jgi:hypothetical protein
MTMYCFVEAFRTITGPATYPIEQEKRANEEGKNSIQCIAHRVRMPVNCSEDSEAE